ncbi:MAG: sigma-70 family RNA polymerase sigma factor [Ruminococcaceae bacterium]|nr:sigma-70 family RNA polymerase sigma factor [Oscillospiraceae bacterium]
MDNGESSYRRFLDGDETAFACIMDDYRLGLIFFINQYLHDIHAAEDVAIDVFTYVLMYPRRYNFMVSLKTYLYVLGRSRALNYLRHRKVIDTLPLDSAETISDDEVDLEAQIVSDERKRAVRYALDSISKDMSEAVYLVYFEELSYKEAAKIMKKSPKQIDNLLYRAKVELRAILGKDGELLL